MTDTPRLAREIVVNHTDHTVHIDGELFPYFLAPTPRVVVPVHGVHALVLCILADSLAVIGSPDPPSPWVGERGPEIVNLPKGSRITPSTNEGESRHA